MSDYLGRLAARSLHSPGAIRPRPTGLFETAATDAVPAVTHAGEEEVAEPVRAAAAEPHVYPARPEAPAVRDAPPARPVQRAPPAAEPVAAPAAPLALTETPSMARYGESSVASAPVARSARLQDAPQTQRTTESRADPLPVPPSVREVPPAAVRPIRRELIGEPPVEAGATVLLPPASRPSARPAVTAAGPEPRSTAAVPQAAPAAPRRPIDVAAIVPAPRVERLDRDRETSMDATVSPTIHVTIGRVEVRASPPPVAAGRPRAAPPPVMSLDEYLKQRGAGKKA